MLHAVIMAGGAGTRFWPESRAALPKQLLSLVGGRTMIQSTVDRLAGSIPPERVLVVTNARLVETLQAQLPELPADSILGEPCKRDTAPCIGLAAFEVSRHDPDAIMAVMPSDHVIGPEAVFTAALGFAAQLVEHSPERIVTFGIMPTYPAESFGYIERGEPLPATKLAGPPVFAVKQFREKPKAAVAKEYLTSGNFYWNSGIFVWRARTILDALERHEPEMFGHLSRIAAARDRSRLRPGAGARVYGHSRHLDRLCRDGAGAGRRGGRGAVRLGRRRQLASHWPAQPDRRPRAIRSRGATWVSTPAARIVRTSDDHLVVTLGLEDCIVVHTPDATLVANKHDEESIRKLVKLIEERGWQQYL